MHGIIDNLLDLGKLLLGQLDVYSSADADLSITFVADFRLLAFR
jgi:hypothetical protein